MDIEILYKDKFIVICLKPAGILSESGGMPEILSKQLGGEFFPVHRLDRAVSGLMVYARSKAAAGKLSGLISGGLLKKEYLAVISGCPSEKEGCFKDLLFKDSGKNKSFVVKRMRKGVKEAELNYKLLEHKEGLSLVEIELITGRSHQIRVQFSSRKMPLAGDVKYGSPIKNCGIALYYSALKFPHPITGKPMEFKSLPKAEYPFNIFIKENEDGKNL